MLMKIKLGKLKQMPDGGVGLRKVGYD